MDEYNNVINSTLKFHSVIADKADKKAIKRFYKSAKAPLSYMGLDTVFCITPASNDEDNSNKELTRNADKHIIGGVVLSQLTSDNHQYLLHALFIEQKYRKKGLSSLLLHEVNKFITEKTNKQGLSQEVIVFAEQDLTSFYFKHAYHEITSESLLAPLALRYRSYIKKQPRLKIFKFQT